MDRLESGELRFNHLAITAKMGYLDQVMDLLEDYLETGRWFSAWFLRRNSDFQKLEDLPRYQKIMQLTEEKEAQYWQDESAKPIIQVPPGGQPPYPLLIAIHGNGFNAMHSARQWACAAEAGWLVFHPLAKKLVGYGSHWWDAHEENCEIIAQQVEEFLSQYPIDYKRVILGGFSKGGETAMFLAIRGWLEGEGLYHHRRRGLLPHAARALARVARIPTQKLTRRGHVQCLRFGKIGS